MFDKQIHVAKTIAITLAHVLRAGLRRQFHYLIVRQKRLFQTPTPSSQRTKNIVIIGASYAGHECANIIAKSLPPQTDYRVVVIEPNSHFQFSWVLPRYCVVPGHEHKAFVPYGALAKGVVEGCVQWIQDRVASVDGRNVKLAGSGKEIPYEFLVIATGAGVEHGLPSRVNETDKRNGIQRLQDMQEGIKAANKVVVVGGGAAGVELAADAKELYPDKSITMIHSRGALMNRFGIRLQETALENFKNLGIDVILNERVIAEDNEAKTVTLKSGRVIECDYFINCTGQKPSSSILAALSPGSILPSGHIDVKPTLQIADPSLPQIYACGDVIHSPSDNRNARSAMSQAEIVADNIIRAVSGKKPSYTYEPEWLDGAIKLTLGINRSVMYFGTGMKEIMLNGKEKEELFSAQCWSHFGQKPFQDPYMETNSSKEV